MPFEVGIYHDMPRDEILIYIFERIGNKTRVIEPVQLVTKEIGLDPNEKMEPFLRLDHRFSSGFLKAFAKAIDEEGIKTDSDAKIQCTLEATKFHLKDLRMLLFNKEGIDYGIDKDK